MKQDKTIVQSVLHERQRLHLQWLKKIKKMGRWERFKELKPVTRVPVEENKLCYRDVPSFSQGIGRYEIDIEKAHELLKESRNKKNKAQYEVDRAMVIVGPNGKLPG